jgi:hypothetical protein
MVGKAPSGGGAAREPERANRRETLNGRAALIFWSAVLSLFTSVIGGIAGSALHVDPTQVEAGLVGAFLGSSPVILMPAFSRLIFGRDSVLADRARLQFRLLTVAYGALIACSRLLHWWPGHTAHTSAAIAIGGLAAAILASWFWPHLPVAACVWARQQLPSARAR